MHDDLERQREAIQDADEELARKNGSHLEVNFDLDRRLVSFQANKQEGFYRWFKYKEGYSSQLIHYLLRILRVDSGNILDPFAGSGTTLFVASDMGLDATGIELLPSSVETIGVRQIVRDRDPKSLAAALRSFADTMYWESDGPVKPIPELRITAGAYPKSTERDLSRFLHESLGVDDSDVARVLRFAMLCVLEEVSYTRKDGQYLRWDWRSGRRAGKKPFYKPEIRKFTDAVVQKLNQIASDIDSGDLFAKLPTQEPGEIRLLEGSCLKVLPMLDEDDFDVLITSPPYCNRYDYTRTYALELACLGIGEAQLKALRQTMLSCTVENKAKADLGNRSAHDVASGALRAFENHELLQMVLRYLDDCRAEKVINNAGIPRMVRNYFLEMAFVIFESARVLRSGAPFVMVNDNVRYQGAHIPVDLILADFARDAGFDVEKIWALPKGKGNSSQQMGEYGRKELRKGVYVWRRR